MTRREAVSITSASPCRTSATALAFYRDALGLEIEAPEEVPSQRVRAHSFPPARPRSNCWKRRRTTRRSRSTWRSAGRAAPHHAARRRHRRGARAVEIARRAPDRRDTAAGRARLARRVHPPVQRARRARRVEAERRRIKSDVSRRSRADLAADGFFRLDGGAMFGVVPKPLWEKRAPADEQEPDHAGDASAAGAAADRRTTLIIDAGNRRQDGREERGDLRDRSLAPSRSFPGGIRA